MASDEWIIDAAGFSSEAAVDRVREFASYAAGKLGLSLDEEVLSDTKIELYYSISSVPGLGIDFSCSYTVSSPTLSCLLMYKNAGGKWTSVGVTMGSFSIMSHETYGCARKNIGTLSVFKVGPQVSGGSISGGITMSSVTAVDYFSSKSRKALVLNNSSSYVYMYDDDKKVANKLTALTDYADYPTDRTLTVALPVIWTSPDFYGFINSSTCLYTINVSASNGDIGRQIELAGHTFEKYLAYWVRLG